MSWINEKGPLRDVVLSSRIRLARNIASLPFPSIMDDAAGRQALEQVRRSVEEGGRAFGASFSFLAMKDLAALDRQLLVEKHLASPDLMKRAGISALMLDKDERIGIMINEEDHIRLQCIMPGFQLDKAWELLNGVDDALEERIEYAFDEQLGYLTSCPTNAGTGLRASTMVHLPALSMTKQMNAILQAISKIGLTARGLYGEGSEALGSIYQISNQVTLGPSEDEIIHNLSVAVQQIISKERQARKALLKINGIEFEDGIWRAFGILTHARRLDIKEFMAYISQLRLGISLGMIPGIPPEQLDSLLVAAQPAGIIKQNGKELSQGELDILRADYVRSVLGGSPG